MNKQKKPTDYGAEVKARRQELGLSVEQESSLACIPAQWIEELEAGKRSQMPMAAVERLADVLGWTAKKLMEACGLFRRTATVAYLCDAEHNTACIKGRDRSRRWCHLHGGPCRATKNPAFAMRDENGELIRVTKQDLL